ncbi:replicative DNA helicase [Candidatus Wolfebacteria bacterium CG10_big_fil_rev_8_21_14_0_10_31_9]|uniref:Replicative DNA helicase n=1 Tax=Candidatus Wolfebacteria bacterium CG10_big_fil_rev_8_21_14_0_10_31_9 TaxID=1975070 RepID=A0A2H0RC86_9BACT|nr:MAG: replicative DNA helicase [Candidatus Wolfebacteria bacterium CG10_big_fil_rev_8_21_14_0_10_31_9]
MAKQNIKIIPQDLEAEKSVLGALMLEKDAIIKIADNIIAEDFYQPSHRKIYEAIVELFSKNGPIDILTVTNKLKDKNELSEIGGSSYLSDLINSVPSAAHIEHYSQIVREKRVLRDLLSTSAQISEEIFNSPDIDNLLDKIEQKVFSISSKSKTFSFTHIKDHLTEAYDRIEKIHHGEQKFSGVSSGFPQLDNYLSGFQKSDLILLGARPSVGKTAFTLDIARRVAKSGHAVAIFSLEMSKEQIIDRIIAAEAQVSLWRLRTGRLTEDIDFQMIQNSLDRLSRMKIFIDDSPSPNILQIRSMARRLQMEHSLDLIIIDYVQLITPARFSENIVQQFTEISHGLKALSRELNVPVLAISQLNRAVDQREIKIPRLSDLRETGAWEQDADIVMFIYRKDKDKINPTIDEQNTADIIIAKHRNGPTGIVNLKFDPEKVSFSEIDTVHQE